MDGSRPRGIPLITPHPSLRFCRGLTRLTNSSFPVAFRLLPPARRDARTALYAFFRATDDLADGPGDPAALRSWRGRLDDALAGRYSHRTHAALHHAVRAFAAKSRRASTSCRSLSAPPGSCERTGWRSGCGPNSRGYSPGCARRRYCGRGW